MHRPIVVTNGRFFVSVETKKPSNKMDFAIDPLAPNKPEEATSWFTTTSKPVELNPKTDRWTYTDLEDRRKELEDRMEEAYDKRIDDILNRPERSNTPTSGETLTTQIHTLSERCIGDALVPQKESREGILKKFRDDLLKTNKKISEKELDKWYESSVRSINAIEDYIVSVFGEEKKVKSYRHVGMEKKIDEKFGTADIIITIGNDDSDDRELGISLKKEGDARLLNTSINTQNIAIDYLKEQQKLLKRVAKMFGDELGEIPENKRLKKAQSKEIITKYGNRKISGQKTLNEVLQERHKKLKENALRNINDIVSENNLIGKIDSVIKNIKDGSLIVVSGGSIVDKDSLTNSGGIDTSNVKISPKDTSKGKLSLVWFETKDKKEKEKVIATIGVRQDGIGYGVSVKLEANFSKTFIQDFKRK